MRDSQAADFKMMHRSLKKFSDGKTYHVFLLGRDPFQLLASGAPPQTSILYQIVVREITNISDSYELQISLELARSLFKVQGCSREEVDETLIVFGRNRSAFLVMIDCLDMVG